MTFPLVIVVLAVLGFLIIRGRSSAITIAIAATVFGVLLASTSWGPSVDRGTHSVADVIENALNGKGSGETAPAQQPRRTTPARPRTTPAG
jgi:hypothetical protein